MMLIDIIIIVIIFDIICNIQFTSQLPVQNTDNDPFITFASTTVNSYRETSIHTKITDDHVTTIWNTFGSSTKGFTTEPSSTSFTTETSNQTFLITSFQTKRLSINPDVVAPDGSRVTNLLTTIGGSMAQFELPPGMTSNAVEHRTVSEIWYFLSGEGEFWRKQNEREEIDKVDANICITIPVGTQFQFRTIGRKNLVAVAITMPPWPGDGEAMSRQGIWNASFIGIGNSSTKVFFNSIYLFIIVIKFLIQ